MNFYTNIQTLGTNILVRSVEDEERVKYTDQYYPILYIKNNDPNGKIDKKSIDGLPLSEITPGNIRETRTFIEQYKDVSGFDIYGVVDWNHMYIGDKFSQCEYDFDKIRICTIDIETESENGFPEVELARERVTVITIKDSFSGNFFVFGLGRDRKYDVVITLDKDGKKQKIVKKIQKRQFNIQRIDGLEEKKVTPPEEVYERIKRENKWIGEARDIDSNLTFFTKIFTLFF